MTPVPEDRFAGLSNAELDLIWRQEQDTMTQVEVAAFSLARSAALEREAEPIPADVRRRQFERARESSLGDPHWAPMVVAHGIPCRPEDLIRVIVPEGSELILMVQAIHAGPRGRAHYLELQSPEDPSVSWFLVRDDGEAWSKGLDLDVESVAASGWTAPTVGRWGSFAEPSESPTVNARVKHERVKASGSGEQP